MSTVKFTFTLKVRDAPGVLVRTAQVFARRSANVSQIHVYPPAGSPWSTMEISVYNIDRVDRIALQLEKLVDVNSVTVRKHVTTDVENPTRSHQLLASP